MTRLFGHAPWSCFLQSAAQQIPVKAGLTGLALQRCGHVDEIPELQGEHQERKGMSMLKLASVMILSLMMALPVQALEQALSWQQVLSQAQQLPEELGLSGEPTTSSASIMSSGSMPSWEEGEQYETTLSMVGISIADGTTVFFMQAAGGLPIGWTPDPEDECTLARAAGQLFFFDDTENPGLVKQSMYLMALNALSRGGRVTLEAGACEALPSVEHTPLLLLVLASLISDSLDLSAISIERVILSE